MASSAGEKKDEAVLTTGWGAPVADNMNSMSAGKLGPLLLQVSVCVSCVCVMCVEERLEKMPTFLPDTCWAPSS